MKREKHGMRFTCSWKRGGGVTVNLFYIILDKERPVVTYCSSSSCGASLTAAAILREHGIDASAYEGGIKEWAEAGLPVEGKLQYSEFYRAGKC